MGNSIKNTKNEINSTSLYDIFKDHSYTYNLYKPDPNRPPIKVKRMEDIYREQGINLNTNDSIIKTPDIKIIKYEISTKAKS